MLHSILMFGLFAGWFLGWFGLAGAGYCERKTLLADWFGLAETNKRTGWLFIINVKSNIFLHILSMIMIPSLYICSPNISLPLNKSSQRLHLQGKQVLQDRVGSKDISSELSHPILKKRPTTCLAGADTIVYDRGLLLLAGLV